MTEVKEIKQATPVMAISVEVQQKASLYALGTVLMQQRTTPNKKAMKKACKVLKKQVKKAIGIVGAKEILSQNVGAVEMGFRGIRMFPNFTPQEKLQATQTLIDDLLPSYLIGVEKVLNGEQA